MADDDSPEERAKKAHEAEKKRQAKIAYHHTLHVITHWERPQQLIADVYYITREVLRRFPELGAKWSEYDLAQFILGKDRIRDSFDREVRDHGDRANRLSDLKRDSFEVFNREWIKSITPVKLARGGGVVYLHDKATEELEFRKRHGITLVTKPYFCKKNEVRRRETTGEIIITYKVAKDVDEALDYTPGRGRGYTPFGVCFSYLFGKGRENYFDQAADITTGAKGSAMAGRALNRTTYNNENEHATNTETDNIIRHAEDWSDMDAINHREELEKMRAAREEATRRKFAEENPDAEEEDI